MQDWGDRSKGPGPEAEANGLIYGQVAPPSVPVFPGMPQGLALLLLLLCRQMHLGTPPGEPKPGTRGSEAEMQLTSCLPQPPLHL